MRNNMRGLLYSLERQWPAPIEYTQIIESNTDDRTGRREIKKLVFNISCILLPEDRVRKFIQDIGYLAANKNFTYGGLNDYNNIRFIVPMYNVPKNLDIDLTGYVVHNNRRFEKLSFNLYADIAYVLVVRGVEGSYPYATISKRVGNFLDLRQRSSLELN